MAKSIDTFYPVRFWQWRGIFGGPPDLALTILDDPHSIHLWNDMLRREKVDKNATFPENSLIEKLKQKYL